MLSRRTTESSDIIDLCAEYGSRSKTSSRRNLFQKIASTERRKEIKISLATDNDWQPSISRKQKLKNVKDGSSVQKRKATGEGSKEYESPKKKKKSPPATGKWAHKLFERIANEPENKSVSPKKQSASTKTSKPSDADSSKSKDAKQPAASNLGVKSTSTSVQNVKKDRNSSISIPKRAVLSDEARKRALLSAARGSIGGTTVSANAQRPSNFIQERKSKNNIESSDGRKLRERSTNDFKSVQTDRSSTHSSTASSLTSSSQGSKKKDDELSKQRRLRIIESMLG
eukprot:588691_1